MTAPPEPWLRGTLAEVPAVIRAVLHALELAREDVHRWCDPLTDDEVNARQSGLPSIAFQINHIAGSLDRMVTYAEGRELSPEQLHEVEGEVDFVSPKEPLCRKLDAALERSRQRLLAFSGTDLEQSRAVGRKRLPSSIGGLIVHIADHTQRHVGQVVTTAQVIRQAKT